MMPNSWAIGIMQNHSYTTIFESEADGTYHAFCPELRGCHSQGDTFEEAGRNINEAIQLYLDSLQAHGEDRFDKLNANGVGKI